MNMFLYGVLVGMLLYAILDSVVFPRVARAWASRNRRRAHERPR